MPAKRNVCLFSVNPSGVSLLWHEIITSVTTHWCYAKYLPKRGGFGLVLELIYKFCFPLELYLVLLARRFKWCGFFDICSKQTNNSFSQLVHSN